MTSNPLNRRLKTLEKNLAPSVSANCHVGFIKAHLTPDEAHDEEMRIHAEAAAKGTRALIVRFVAPVGATAD